MVHPITAALHVRIHHLPATDPGRCDRFARLGGTAAGPNARGAVLNIGFAARLDHQHARVWDHTVPHRRHPSRALPSIRLGEIDPPPRWRSLPPGPQIRFDPREARVHSLALDLRSADAIDAGTPPVRASFSPGPPQHSGPVAAVVERMDPTVPAPVGRAGLACAGVVVSGLLGVVGPVGHAPALTSALSSVAARPFPPLEWCCLAAPRSSGLLRRLRQPPLRLQLPPSTTGASGCGPLTA